MNTADAKKSGKEIERAIKATLLALILVGCLATKTPATATAFSFDATYQGSAYGLVDGTYYDGGGYGIAPADCPPSVCVFTSLPAQATVSGTIITTLGRSASNTPQLNVTEAFSLHSTIGSTSTTFSYTTPNVNYVPTPGDWQVNFPNLGNATGLPFGSAGALSDNPSFIPPPGTSGSIQLTSGAIALNKYAGQFLPGTGVPLPYTLLSGTLVSGTSSYGSNTPPPSLQQLVALNEDFYNNPFPQGAGSYKLLQYVPGSNGFSAAVYSTGNLGDGGQIVIIPQATAGKTPAQTAYELLADVSYVNGTPTTAFTSQVKQSADLVANLAALYPNAQITLSGYSLGGGIAQIVGHYSGVQTVTFDAPGSSQFLSSFSNLAATFSGQNIFSPSTGNWAYRLEGDLISAVGTQVGQTITVLNPQIHLTPCVTLPAACFGQFHLLAPLDGLLVGVPPTPGDLSDSSAVVPGEPDAPLVNDIIDGAAIAVGKTFYQTAINQLSATAAKFDPPAGYEYQLAIAVGSADISGIYLPVGLDLAGDNVSGWDLTYVLRDGTIGFLSSDLGLFDFSPGVMLLDFFPIDLLGNHISYSAPYIFGLTFSDTGPFSATLTTLDAPSQPPSRESVPEPPSLVLLGSAILMLLAIACRDAPKAKRPSPVSENADAELRAA